MDVCQGKTGSVSSSSSGSQSTKEDSTHHANHPFETRYGRRFLRDLPYPLPVDLAEIQRENLRTLLGVTIFGKPICSPLAAQLVPKKVLEIGCGSGYWSSLCHDYFASRGHPDVSFVGLDIAPLAADLQKQGIDWHFVQHDLRRAPLPFDDEEFDLVMLKDLSLTIALGDPAQRFVDEVIRTLKCNGVLEIWESDYVLRSLLPHPPFPPGKVAQDQEVSLATGTFLISPGTPFAPAQNVYIKDSNAWLQEALHARHLPPTPCSRVAQVLFQEPESLGDIGFRRVAIPLAEMGWEHEAVDDRKCDSMNSRVGTTPHRNDMERTSGNRLTKEQAAIRSIALLTVLQMIESLEPLLKEVSGKNAEEWSHWWAGMMTDLIQQKGAASGECLEVGAWWARKISS
ncbi:hypothetical protein LTR66_001297 [Elasticomyces elasticus]|nr:hypothetical protein LTR66_001297 [Elasticomyces elasticus]